MPLQFIAVRKTLEANMHMADMFPPGRVLWALRDSDLHPLHRLPKHGVHQKKDSRNPANAETEGKDRLRLFEVLDVEKVFSQIVFAKDMLRYDSHFLFPSTPIAETVAVHICHISMTECYTTFCNSQT
jgi:hypothetical protein